MGYLGTKFLVENAARLKAGGLDFGKGPIMPATAEIASGTYPLARVAYLCLFGYGTSTWTDDAATEMDTKWTRRTGKNKVQEVSKDGAIVFSNNVASSAYTSIGDSGGPLVKDGKVYGVLSSGTSFARDSQLGKLWDADKLSIYGDVAGVRAKQLIQLATQGGAKIDLATEAVGQAPAQGPATAPAAGPSNAVATAPTATPATPDEGCEAAAFR